MKRLISLLLGFTYLTCAFAQTREPAVRQAVDAHLQVQINGLPGKASYRIDTIQTQALAACQSFDVSTTPGAPAIGRSSVTVRCAQGATWSILVPVRIQLYGAYLVSARPIRPGQLLVSADIGRQHGDLGELPIDILTDPDQAVGRVAKAALPPGRPLRGDLLKDVTVVLQGQSVKLTSRGFGFEVSNEGRAMNSASAGQVVQVRLGNGQIVSGVAAADGSVLIRH